MGLVGLSRGLVQSGQVSDLFISGILSINWRQQFDVFTLWGFSFSPWCPSTGVRADTQVLLSTFLVAEAMINQVSYSKTFVETSSPASCRGTVPFSSGNSLPPTQLLGWSLCLPSTQPPQGRALDLRVSPSKSLIHVNTFSFFLKTYTLHWLNVHEFQQTPGDGEGQGSLACYSPWGLESDTTQQLNNNNRYYLNNLSCLRITSSEIGKNQPPSVKIFIRKKFFRHKGICLHLYNQPSFIHSLS